MEASDIIVFDVETTGTDRRRDQIIELCIQWGLESSEDSKTWRFCPSVPIHPGAQAVHGISMEDLADCAPFASHADEIRALFLRAKVLVGYNMSFDIGMLQAEYHRLEQPLLKLRGKKLVDPFRLWQQCEPRSLQHAHMRFVGDSFDAAHSASADVAATGRVLQGMVESFGLGGHDWGRIADVCEPERASWIGSSRHIRWAPPDGTVVLGFGRHLQAPLHALANSSDRDYLLWILDKDFPPHVHAICKQAMELPLSEFRDWIHQTFGQAPLQLQPPTPAPAVPKPREKATTTPSEEAKSRVEPSKRRSSTRTKKKKSKKEERVSAQQWLL